MFFIKSIFRVGAALLIVVLLMGAFPADGFAAPESHSPLPAGLNAADWAQVRALLPDAPDGQPTYIKASNTDPSDGFGWSLSLSDDTLVVGTTWEDSNATGIDGNQADNSMSDSGAVYVFTRSGTTWSQQAYIKASNTNTGDNFGTSVAILGDTLAVGAKLEDSNATGIDGNQADNSAGQAGAVYIFTRSGTVWSQQAYIKASNTGAGDNFGISLALANDTLVVGAMWEDSNATGINGNQADNSAADSGAVYVFTRSGTIWSQQAYVKASNTGANDAFGEAISLSGDTLAVGAHTEDSSATGIDGNQTDNSLSDSGAVYIFTRSGTTWSQQAYIKASNTGFSDDFGVSVALLGDTLAVGAYEESSNAIGINGDQTNNSSSRSGAVYIFARSGTVWSQQAYIKASNTGNNDRFGSSLAFSGDTLAVGAWGEASNATGMNGDQYNDAAIESGAVYVFTRSGTTWSQTAYIKASNTHARDKFGSVVSLSNGTLAVGAVYENSNAIGINGNQTNNLSPYSGATYVFEDVNAPTVLSFAANPPSTNSLDIPLPTFTASDNIGVTGYLITTNSSVRPSAGAAGWVASLPAIYTASDYGHYFLYPWVKDAAGNVSTVYSSPIPINVCASNMTVTSTADSGLGTLRKAIADACSDATITFDNALSAQTIYLNSTLHISRNLIIDGSMLASPITISGDSDNNGTGNIRVFQVGSTTEMKNLIITKGYVPDIYGTGGGIFNSGGTLTLVNSTISNSFAHFGAGIYSYSILTLINSRVVNNSTGSPGSESHPGGGIYNDGALTIINSTISNNTAVSGGGGIYNNQGKPLTIQNSTFSGNSGGSGGAIHNQFSTVTITNSTFSGNSALSLGGGIRNSGLLVIRNSTFSGNSASSGGGIYNNASTLDYANTIIANSSGGDCVNPGNWISTNINNLVEDGSCSAAFSGDPNMGPLVDNGGPTHTFALLPGSPAINAGNDATCTASQINNLDQRGLTRSSNGPHCDIGAYEYQDASAPLVTAFSVPSPSTSLDIPITAFSASDDVGLAGYKITESSTPPVAEASGWTASPPTTYTVTSNGAYTLYPWVKDAAGNVSAIYGSPANVTVNASPTPTTTPTDTATATATSSPTNTATSTETNTATSTSSPTKTATPTEPNTATSTPSPTKTATRTQTPTQTVGASPTTTESPTGTMTPTSTTTSTPTLTPTRVMVTLSLLSIAAQDGWLLESTETSNSGGTLDSTATTFRVGDDAIKKQYRGILSFNTASLPDTAVITSVTLRVKKNSATGSGDPLSIFNGFMTDIQQGFFGTAAALQISDFQAAPSKVVGPTSPTLTSGWYSLNLNTGKTFINKLSSNGGVTQIRLRFKLDDNNDSVANYLSLFSGNATNAADRPQLVITYTVP